MSSSTEFKMTVDLNVLNHLGIRLYSSIPAVISEAVANSWDADAELVSIEIDEKSISITDDGIGMTSDDINQKFLAVGYQRRKDGHATSPSGRSVHGRKGIGKLSLFSIADTIIVESCKDGEWSGLKLHLPDIQKDISLGNNQYKPAILPDTLKSISKGTKITITNIRKKTNRAPAPLRRRIARRFANIGKTVDGKGFEVKIGGEPIVTSDREYYKKLEFMWSYGTIGKEISKSTKAEIFERDSKFSGWIGTVKSAGDLISVDEDNLNDIQIFVRGRVAQEKTLQFFGEDGIYASYVVGEIHADWLDDDQFEDIATTNRQTLIEDDPRVIELREAIKTELKHVQNKWTSLRNAAGTKQALKIPEVEIWFKSLGPDQQGKAKQLFGKINKLRLDEADKKPLFKYGLLAFEKLRLKDNLSRIEYMEDADFAGYLQAFQDHDELEAQLYHEISKGRLEIINSFENLTEENALEKVLQQYLFEHLWLLDPAWDRAATDPVMEVEVKKAVLDGAEFDGEYMKEIGRVDIQYRKSGGEHIIIELKRAGRVVSSSELVAQVAKYQAKMEQLLTGMGRTTEPYEIICLVGKDLSDWSVPRGRKTSFDMLKSVNARVMTYQELIGNAKRAYSEYLDASRDASKIFGILKAIDLSLDSE